MRPKSISSLTCSEAILWFEPTSQVYQIEFTKGEDGEIKMLIEQCPWCANFIIKKELNKLKKFVLHKRKTTGIEFFLSSYVCNNWVKNFLLSFLFHLVIIVHSNKWLIQILNEYKCNRVIYLAFLCNKFFKNLDPKNSTK